MKQLKEVDSGSHTTVLIEGSVDEVQKMIDDYLKDYPENAYMTHINEEGMRLDGGYYCKLWRLSSCD